jgi:hypothetical protein
MSTARYLHTLITVGLLLSSAARANAAFFITPAFDTAPAVVSDAWVNGYTVVLAGKNSGFQVLVPGGGENSWLLGTAELTSTTVPQGYDSGPAAVRISGLTILFCGHQTGSNTPIFCGIGQPEKSEAEKSVLFPVSVSPRAVPGGTFPQWMRPALVKNSSGSIFLFGRGMDNQMYWTPYLGGGKWGWWTAVRADPFGFVNGDPVATIDSNGKIVLCARSAFTQKPRCTTQTSSGNPTSWDYWTDGPRMPLIKNSMALTTTSAGISLLAIEFYSPNREISSFFQNGSWSTYSVLPVGSSFQGLGASVTPGFPTVLSSAWGGCNALWWTHGSAADGGNNSWHLVQAWYPYSRN